MAGVEAGSVAATEVRRTGDLARLSLALLRPQAMALRLHQVRSALLPPGRALRFSVDGGTSAFRAAGIELHQSTTQHCVSQEWLTMRTHGTASPSLWRRFFSSSVFRRRVTIQATRKPVLIAT